MKTVMSVSQEEFIMSCGLVGEMGQSYCVCVIVLAVYIK